MKDSKNKRKNKKVTKDLKKEKIEQKEEQGDYSNDREEPTGKENLRLVESKEEEMLEENKKDLKELISLIFVVLLAFFAGMVVQTTLDAKKILHKEENLQQEVMAWRVVNIGRDQVKDIKEQREAEKEQREAERESNSNNKYVKGVLDMQLALELRDYLIETYKMTDNIKYIQMKEYVESTLNIINLALNNSDIPPEAIDNYNKIIKEISLIDYDTYKLKSTGEEYLRGLKDYLVANSCRQIVNYYSDSIPIEEMERFTKVLNIESLAAEDYLELVIKYGKALIQDYIGRYPDEVLVSTEWRVFTGMPEK